jgi:hypothetical protein
MNFRSTIVFSPLAICLAVLGCEDRTVVADETDRDPAVLAPDLFIGQTDGDPEYLFGDVRSVAVDDEGRVYVGDRIGATIRAYDASGQYLGQIAREGEGPGEIIGWPADLLPGRDGSLTVRDAQRITVFAPREPGGLPDSVAAIWRLSGYGNLSATRSRAAESGAYLYPDNLFRDDELPRFFYLPFRDGTAIGDTLEVPPYASLAGRRRAYYRISQSSGRLLDGLSHVPFAPLATWDATRRGTILSSDGADCRLIETNLTGDTVRVIAGPDVGPRPIPPSERDDSLRALSARIDTLPVPLDEVRGLGEGVAQRRLPPSLPCIVGIHVATDGSIWVERWPDEGQGQSRFFEVLDGDGEVRGHLALQAPLVKDPPPFFGSRYLVGVVADPITGVERVALFSLTEELLVQGGR